MTCSEVRLQIQFVIPNPEQLSSVAHVACRMTDIQNPGPKGEVGRSHGRPGTVKETLLFDQEIREGQTVSLLKHTGGEAVAVALWNASWHSEQGKHAQQSSQTGELNKEVQGGQIRIPEEPHRTIQTSRSKVTPVIFS